MSTKTTIAADPEEPSTGTTAPTGSNPPEGPPAAGPESVEIEITEPDVAPTGEPQKKDDAPPKKNEAQLKAAKISLEKMLLALGSFTADITGIPGLAFSAEERDLLADVWAPYMPAMPGMTLALMITIPIVGGKVSLYLSQRKKKNPPPDDKMAKPKETDPHGG